jgi:integrase/recombinase XerD
MSSEIVPVHRRNLAPVTRTAELVPAFVADAGEDASRRFIEFFTVNIRNANTRAAYLRAVRKFADWCDDRGFRLDQLEPVAVAAYIEELGKERPEPTVKQALAAIRMFFDWMVTGHIIDVNPAHAVRGPRYSPRRGKTPVLDAEQARQLLDAIDTSTLVGLRDRAMLAAMCYTFARVGAVVSLKVEDFFHQGKRWWLRLHEKNGKVIEMPCHHNLEAYIDAYIDAAGIRENRKGPLFRLLDERTHRDLTEKPMTRLHVWKLVKRRAKAAELPPEVCCHTFRATGITTYLKNGGTLEKAKYMAGHESARTTGLYDRREEEVSLDEVERIVI